MLLIDIWLLACFGHGHDIYTHLEIVSIFVFDKFYGKNFLTYQLSKYIFCVFYFIASGRKETTSKAVQLDWSFEILSHIPGLALCYFFVENWGVFVVHHFIFGHMVKMFSGKKNEQVEHIKSIFELLCINILCFIIPQHSWFRTIIFTTILSILLQPPV